MRKTKFYLDFEKEEEWLNDMLREGWLLRGKSLDYQFEKIDTTGIIIKIDYRSFKSNEDFYDYLQLFNDSGWLHIAGRKSSGKQYFKKYKADKRDDIFSDLNSKGARYKRLSNMWRLLGVSYIPIFTALIMTNNIDSRVILNPKLLYYTPGLWERKGIHFATGFIFETPFALMRGFTWFALPILIILYFLFAYMARRKYNKSLNI